MKIDKDTVLDFLRQHGGEDRVPEADEQLPDQVDTDRDSGLLARFGIDVGELIAKLPEGLTEKLPGGLGDKLGGLLDK